MPARAIATWLLALYVGAAGADDAPLRIDITTHLGDRQEFQHGDRVQFLLDLNRDAYVLLIYQDAAGALTQLVPNNVEPSGFYKAARYLRIPDRRVPFEFVVGPPYGTETVWAFGSDTPLPELPGTPLSNGLKRLNIEMEEVTTLLGEASKRGPTRIVTSQVQLVTRGAAVQHQEDMH
jgi:hypothetical protein